MLPPSGVNFNALDRRFNENLLHLAFVGAHRRELLVNRAPQRDRTPVGALLHQHQRVFNGGRQVEIAEIQFHPTRFDL